MSRYAAHRIRVLVVDLAAQALVTAFRVLFGRGALLGRARAESARTRFHDLEHSFAHHVSERLACDARETGGQHDVAEVAVAELADVLRQRFLRSEPHNLLRGGSFLPKGFPPGESRRMCEDLPESHPVLVPAAEVGDELAEWHVELQLTLAYE